VPDEDGQAVVQAVLSNRNKNGENSDEDELEEFTLSGLQNEVDANQQQKKVGWDYSLAHRRRRPRLPA
jgi:hypothetical protein